MIATERETATVLVVDDDHDVRTVTSMLLERAGYEVISVEGARAGLDVLREHPDDVDVVLLDVMMPGMTGHEAYLRIRELRQDLPVIFFSGYGRHEVAPYLERDPKVAFLGKPSDISTMSGQVARMLQSYG